MLHLLLFLAVVTKLSAERANKTHSIQPIYHNLGIYIERLQDIRYSTATWKMIIFVDTKSLQFNATNVTTIITSLENNTQSQFWINICRIMHATFDILNFKAKQVQIKYANLIDAMQEINAMEPVD